MAINLVTHKIYFALGEPQNLGKIATFEQLGQHFQH